MNLLDNLNQRFQQQAADQADLSGIPGRAVPPVRTARQRLADAASQPEILPLVGPIWQSGELHILFADTGVGKSIMAVSIADALSKGTSFLELANGFEPQKVLFYDFELSDKQFQKRYKHPAEDRCYEFSDRLFIDNIDWVKLDEVYPRTTFEAQVFHKFRHDLSQTDAEVLVVDNLTFLQAGATENTQVALDLMRELNKLKRERGLSVLVLAHTPKIQPGSALSLNHLAGSKMISNFADSVSALGKSVIDSNIRYWKQVKPSRSAELTFDAHNVLGMKLVKRDNLFLTFEWWRYDAEEIHLNEPSDKAQEKQDRIEVAKKLKDQGKSVEEIAEELGVSRATAYRYLNK